MGPQEIDPLLPDQGPAKEATKVYRLTDEQRVCPPPWLRGAELDAWLLADLEKAIGKEFIDYDFAEQPFVKKPRQSAAPPARPDPATKKATPQGDLFDNQNGTTTRLSVQAPGNSGLKHPGACTSFDATESAVLPLYPG